MRLIKRLKHNLVYYLAKFLIWLINLLPRSITQPMGATIGHVAWALLLKDRARIEKNLVIAYGDELSGSERYQICREFFINSGKNLTDIVRVKKYYDSEIRALIEIEGMHHLKNALARGKGAFGVSGHIGNFELMAVCAAEEGIDTAVIARTMYDPRMDKLLLANRQAGKITNIATTDSPRLLLNWLKKGGCIGVLIDAGSSKVRGEMIPWFGHPALTPIGQSLIALKTGAAMVPTFCVRIDHNRYKFIARQEVTIERTNDLEADAIRLTSACIAEIEDIITTYKSQWIWLHDRWNVDSRESS